MSRREQACSRCGIPYPRTREFFQVDNQKADGLRPDCKPCRNALRHDAYMRRREVELAQTKEYARRNREKVRIASRKRYERRVSAEAGKQKMRAAAKAWRRANIERARKYDSEWMQNNRGLHVAKAALARARRKQAAPRWLTQDHLAEMKSLYRIAAVFGMHVDHIFPIAGKMARGLHVPWNLQILSAHANMSKGNGFVAKN